MACRTPSFPNERVGRKKLSNPDGMVCSSTSTTLMHLARGIEWVLSQTIEAWRILSANAFDTVAESSWEVSAAMFEKALVNAQNRAARGEIGALSLHLATMSPRALPARREYRRRPLMCCLPWANKICCAWPSQFGRSANTPKFLPGRLTYMTTGRLPLRRLTITGIPSARKKTKAK
jgi:hypothetical protein